ncbi:MAG: hypothetical protein WCP91_03525, partial [Candidatus Berkelbacteria bacterium]
ADHIAHIAAANHSYFRKAAVEKDAELRATGLAEVRGTLGSLENVQEKADTLRSEFDGSLLEVEELKLSIARIRELVPEGNPMSPVLATKIKAIEQRQRGIEDGMGALFQKSKEAIGLAESLKDYDQLKSEIDLLSQGTKEIYALPRVADLLYQEAIDTDEQETNAVELGKQERRLAREQATAIEKENALAVEREKAFKQELVKKLSDRAARLPALHGEETNPNRREFTEPLIAAFLDDVLEQNGVDKIELTAASADQRRELIRTVADQIEYGLKTAWNQRDFPSGFGPDPIEAKRIYEQNDPKGFGRQLGNMLGTVTHHAGTPDVLARVIGNYKDERERDARLWHRSIPFMIGFARGSQETRSATKTKIEEQPARIISAMTSPASFGKLAQDVKLGIMVTEDNIARAAYESGVAKSEEIYQKIHQAVVSEQEAAEK